MRYCQYCGGQMDDNARFCSYCGREVVPVQAAQGPAVGSSMPATPVAAQAESKTAGSRAEQHDTFFSGSTQPAGQPVNQAQPRTQDSGLVTVALIFLILGTIAVGIVSFFIGLIWCIPMTVVIYKRLRSGVPVGIGLKVCALLFVSLIAGIILLCMEDGTR